MVCDIELKEVSVCFRRRIDVFENMLERGDLNVYDTAIQTLSMLVDSIRISGMGLEPAAKAKILIRVILYSIFTY